jgi:hypothetical protein
MILEEAVKKINLGFEATSSASRIASGRRRAHPFDGLHFAPG